MTNAAAAENNPANLKLVSLIVVAVLLSLAFTCPSRLGLLNPLLLLLSLLLLFMSFFSAAVKTIGGPLSLACLICTFAFLEGTLQLIPSKVLPEHVHSPPPLAPVDQAKLAFDSHGFRGRQACQANCPDNFLRIITLGGSSTYGLPLVDPEATYSGQLNRILKRRRPDEHYEVLNAGLAGAGIMQELDLLRERLLRYKPDIVTINSFFNDSARVPGWYGVPGKSDKQAFEQFYFLWKLQGNGLYTRIHNTRLFGLFRHSLLYAANTSALADKPKVVSSDTRRMSPSEFQWALEQIAALGRKHKFLPVFMLEPFNRSFPLNTVLGANHYYKVTKRVAQKEQLPMIDFPTEIHENSRAWLFYDFIHPNRQGHRLLAEVIYRNLFTNPLISDFLGSRGIKANRPLTKPIQSTLVSQREFSASGGQFRIATPFNRDLKLLLNVGYGPKTLFTTELSSNVNDIHVPGSILDGMSDPYVKLSFWATNSSRNVEQFKVGSTGVISPKVIQVRSAGKYAGSHIDVLIDGQKVDLNHRGFNVISLGVNSGKVYYSGAFDIFGSRAANLQFHKIVSDITANSKEPQIVIIAVKSDGFYNVDRKLIASTLRSIGGTGTLPSKFGSFYLIGSPGAEPGTALEAEGMDLLSATIGDSSELSQRLLADFK